MDKKIHTELSTFLVKKGKEARAEEWMKLLQEKQAECVETLPREQMLFESVFKFYKNERMYLTWFSVQKEGHKKIDTSEHEIDKLHLQFWNECLERNKETGEFPSDDHQHVVSFLPKELEEIFNKLY